MGSTKKENQSDPESDPVVEIFQPTGHEFLKKSQISKKDIGALVVRCTICLMQVNHKDPKQVKRHRILNVLVCKDCYGFYGEEEFSVDESGNYNYCTWCGQGGKLFLCDFCPNTFCGSCVHRNMGRGAVAAMSKEGWQCFCCDPQKLAKKVAYCDLILEYSRNCHEGECKKKAMSNPKLDHKVAIIPWDSSKDWIIPAFDQINSAGQEFQKRIDKLKDIGISQSKSVKQVVKKMEEILNSFKTELSHIVKELSNNYSTSLEKQKIEERRKTTVCMENEDSNMEVDDSSTGKTEKAVLNEDFVELPQSREKEDKAKLALLASSSSDSEESLTISTEKQNGFHSLVETRTKVKAGGKKCKQINVAKADLKKCKQIDEPKVDKKKCKQTEEPKEECAEIDKIKADEKEHTHNQIDEPQSDEKCKQIDDTKAEILCPLVFSDSEEDVLPNVMSDINLDSSSDSDIPCIKSNSKNIEPAKKKLFNLSTSEFVTSSIVKKTEVPKSVVDNSENLIDNQVSCIPDQPNTDIPKCTSNVSVVLENCDFMLNGLTTIPLPRKYLEEDIEKKCKEIDELLKFPSAIKKNHSSAHKETSKRKKISVPKLKKSDGDSSSIHFSSEEDSDSEEKGGLPDLLDILPSPVKPNLESERETHSSMDNSSIEEEEEVIKKPKGKKTKPHSDDSSDDFQPRKKLKRDKFLNKRFTSSDEEDSKESKPERKKKQDGKKRSDEIRLSSDSVHTTTSESEEDKKKKKKKRIKKRAVSSSGSNAENPEEGKEGSQNTPGKGRKNIRKITKDLATETQEAQQIEKERRRRIAERQKMYNVIKNISTDGLETKVTKFVLEVDSESKEEIVQICPELVDKLKPHQVKGVKFMWECTIESLKQLEKEKGSGCILAHCMGLGKTLQVITFLHMCLTNKWVNKTIKTAMVICPYNTVLNWYNEFEKWLDYTRDGDDILIHELNKSKDNYERLDVLKHWKNVGGVLIVGYDLFRRLSGKKIPKMNGKNRDKLHSLLIDPGADIVICDEGHVLKNENSAVSKACSQLKTLRRIVLTGTPLQNNLAEYHCMLSFVKPHLLGTSKEFRNRFVNPIMNGQYDDSNEFDVKRMKKRIHILHKLLEGCVQRCDYSALTKFLPPKHEFVISVKLSETQAKMYRWYLDNLSKSSREDKIRGSTLFADYNSLRNICTHPYIIHTNYVRAEKKREQQFDDEDEMADFIDDESENSEKSKSGSGSDDVEIVKQYRTRSRKNEESDVESADEATVEKKKCWYQEFISTEDRYKLELSGKMIILFDILKECETIGDKVIVFSQSLLTLDCIEDILEWMDEQEPTEEDKARDIIGTWVKNLDYFRMDGTTSADFRKSFIDRFNSIENHRARLFLVSTKAGGLGTNLVGANRVVMMDASWNPSHDVQAIFRVYRFGQTKPVYIYRLLGSGTMEEKIYDRQVTKLSLSIRVVDEQQIDRHFGAAELAELYNFEPEVTRDRPTPMVPRDTLLAEMLIKFKDWIVTYHEHDSLLQNETEEDLTEEERQAAWNEYENEREGRVTHNIDIDDEIRQFLTEPNLDEATYSGTMIPQCKVIIEKQIDILKRKFPKDPVTDLRKRLLFAIHTLRLCFQEKHLKIIRIKQDYIANGSVPTSVNSYLDELSNVLKELQKHYTNIYNMVEKDKLDAQQKLLQQRAAQQQQHFPQGFRFPPQQTFQQQQQQQFVNMNNYTRLRGMFMAQRFSHPYSNTTTPEAMVIEDDPVEIRPNTTTHVPSSVVIEEIE